jgi:redox-sensitive bicupin YhaK (pirin superfamily)
LHAANVTTKSAIEVRDRDIILKGVKRRSPTIRKRRAGTRDAFPFSDAMIVVRRAGSRRHVCFAGLEAITVNTVPPGRAFDPNARGDCEILTYVLEGALAHEDRAGNGAVIHPGEFERLSPRCGARPCEMRNASDRSRAHVLQASLRTTTHTIVASSEQKRFCTGERRGLLRLIASPNAREGSLRLHRDARVYSALLEPGLHVVHPLEANRCAWVHVVSGEAALSEIHLRAGDGAGLRGEPAVSLTAKTRAEVLIFDLPEPV